MIADPADQPIHDAAVAATADVICTYNPNDFKGGQVPTISPIGLMKAGDAEGVGPFVQEPMIAEAGTILVIAKLDHPSSLGRVMRAKDLLVETDTGGRLLVAGAAVASCRTHAQLSHESLAAIIFRYKKNGYFEGSQWSKPSKASPPEFEKTLLCDGKAAFTSPTPCLVFERNHKFFGSVRNISGAPFYVRDRHMSTVLQNECLESIWGGEGLESLLAGLDIVRDKDGSYYVGSPEWGKVKMFGI